MKRLKPQQVRRHQARRGFTLMEVMIAVAALAVLAVAMAAIFDMTGRTVTAGKRMSAVNAYAAMIEQQMRDDFASMTRDGFLVIRNQYADARLPSGQISLPAYGQQPDPNQHDVVWVHPDDGRPRPRRVDELLFFAKGDFTTAREPLHPELIARGDAARIYYGHGQRGHQNDNSYGRPELNDTNQHPLAILGFDEDTNPNLYASEWTLLRHLTVLVPRGDGIRSTLFAGLPQNSRPTLRNTELFPNANNDDRLLDSEIQVAAQPAASSIFRALSETFPTAGQLMNVQNPASRAIRRGGNVRPQFTSGLVDIAATNLPEIRAIVTTGQVWPVPGSGAAGWDPGGWLLNDAFYTQFSEGHAYYVQGLDEWRLQRTQAWMENAFPSVNNVVPAYPPLATQPQQRRRVRYESMPPNLVGAKSGIGNAGPAPADLQTAFRRADQAMLASWGFIPHCTEFIVEWSFGRRFPRNPGPGYVQGREGDLIWHGLERVAHNAPLSATHVPLATPLLPTSAPANLRAWQAPEEHYAMLIHGREITNEQRRRVDPLMSYFGYFDPTYGPGSQDPGFGGSSSQPATRDWPWPRYIRVTLSVADPRDPSTEHTFQFVFDVPEKEN